MKVTTFNFCLSVRQIRLKENSNNLHRILLSRRTADVRSVGYSELFSLSREDVLAAMKDYPEAQEILQNLGRKRLMEAQKVARASKSPSSPGHDSVSDNSTSKRIADKLKVRELKNVLRKSRRSAKQDEGVELEPLTSKVPPLRRQTRVEESHDASSASTEAPMSPLGAGLPLLNRLRLLKEKQDREEKRTLVEVPGQSMEVGQSSSETSSQNLLQRILMLKSKGDQEPLAEKESVIKEPLLPGDTIPEETELTQSQEIAEESEKEGEARKSWNVLKNASLKTKDEVAKPKSPKKRYQQKQRLVHLRQKTKMYASVDDLSPEYCGLPFVKKLKILNERQKLAELERAVRSSSLDCGESMDSEFDVSLTRSHSEACAIEYARKLAKLNRVRMLLLLRSGFSFHLESFEIWYDSA